jgi:hypothetical protein
MSLPLHEGSYKRACGSVPEGLGSTATVSSARSHTTEQIHNLPDRRFLTRRSFAWGSIALVLSCGVQCRLRRTAHRLSPFAYR